ncbi:MAG: hypothetical protein LUE27_11480 [Clostridia bacterium]|nr:hypothetical protein [Clostridia bacterium]
MKVREFFEKAAMGTLVKVANKDRPLITVQQDYMSAVNPLILNLDVQRFMATGSGLGSETRIVLQVDGDVPVVARDAEELQALMLSDEIMDIALGADIIEETADNAVELIGDGETPTTKRLYLNGHDISIRSEGNANKAAIYASGAMTELIIYGDASSEVYGGAGAPSNVAVWAANGAQIDIHGGTYLVGLDSGGAANSTIYASGGSNIYIHGGYFKNTGSDSLGITAEKRTVLNIQDGSGSSITCSGGIFKNQDPVLGDWVDKDTGATFVAESCNVWSRDASDAFGRSFVEYKVEKK